MKALFPKGEITSFQLLFIDPKATNLIATAITMLQTNFIRDFDSVVTETLEHYNSNAPIGISKTKLKEMQRSIMKAYISEYYYNETIDTRINKLRTRLLTALSSELGAEQLIGADIGERLASRFYSTEPVVGGTLYGQASNLLVSEENRLYHITAMMFFGNMGVQYLRFCLTPSHEEEDVCDSLANWTNLTTARIAKTKGINPTGVYLRTQFPDPPHPRAEYYIEPLYTLGYHPQI